jgi:hypothetical protein
MVNGAAYWVESQDRYLEQSLDYLANNIYSIRGEIIHDAAGANSLELGQSGGADLAEHYYSSEALVPGQVVQLDTTQKSWVKLSNAPYQANVLGVVSTAPGITLGEQTGQGYPIGLVGRVPVKVTDENGPIRVGDYLTSSSTPGYAMRATYAGPVIGQALENYSESSIEECPEVSQLMEPMKQCGQILMFIKTTYYNGISSQGTVSEKESSSSASIQILGNIRQSLSQVGGSWDASEMIIGKLRALEILGGEISTDLLRLETLQTYTGKDLNIQLNEGGEMVVLNEAKESVFSIDALGNAIFKGTVQADKIKANQIEGLQILAEELVTSQLRQATASGRLLASASAELAVTVNEATAAANPPHRECAKLYKQNLNFVASNRAPVQFI